MLITTKENHERALKKVHPFIKAVMKAMVVQEDNFMGKDVIKIGHLTVQDYGPFDDLDVEYDGDMPKGEDEDEMSFYEAFDKYVEELSKDKKNTVTIHIDG